MKNIEEDLSASRSSITTKAPVYRAGSRFLPTDLGLVRRYLRDMVDKNKSGFITTLDVYNDDPWLLNHVDNDLFKRNEWYYFVLRNKRGGKTSKRTVSGRGESEGGTWKSNNGKVAITDINKKVEGYRQNLVYNKTVKGEVVKTDWLMTEYSLHKDIHDDLVLCHIRFNTGKNANVKQVPQVENNILSNQVQDEEAGLTGAANRIEMTMPQVDHGYATQQQEILSLPPLQSNDNNIMMWWNQVQEEEAAGFSGFAYETDMRMLDGEHGDTTRHQQQDTPFLSLPLLQGQDDDDDDAEQRQQRHDDTVPRRI